MSQPSGPHSQSLTRMSVTSYEIGQITQGAPTIRNRHFSSPGVSRILASFSPFARNPNKQSLQRIGKRLQVPFVGQHTHNPKLITDHTSAATTGIMRWTGHIARMRK